MLDHYLDDHETANFEEKKREYEIGFNIYVTSLVKEAMVIFIEESRINSIGLLQCLAFSALEEYDYALFLVKKYGLNREHLLALMDYEEDLEEYYDKYLESQNGDE